MFGKVRDPVCHVKIKKDTKYQTKYNGRDYYFDCAACMKTFSDNPKKYARGKRESFLERMTKASDGISKSCHSITK